MYRKSKYIKSRGKKSRNNSKSKQKKSRNNSKSKQKKSRNNSKSKQKKRKYRFDQVVNKSNDFFKKLKTGTTTIYNLLEEVIKTWKSLTPLNKMDEFYIEGSYVKYVNDMIKGRNSYPISDIDFHTEIKQYSNMRNETENFADHLIQILDIYKINFVKKQTFLYRHQIPAITISIEFVNSNTELKFKNPSQLEFEFSITPTLINPIEITKIPKIIYILNKYNKLDIISKNMTNSYEDISINYIDDLDLGNWSNIKSNFLDRNYHELYGRNTLSDHVDHSMSKLEYKPWEEYYDIETISHDFHTGEERIIPSRMKAGLDMSVEERVGKVFGTWFTKTNKITPNIIYMTSTFLNLKGHIKDGIDSFLEITRYMLKYLNDKNITTEQQRTILISYSILILYSIRYNLGTGCKKLTTENIAIRNERSGQFVQKPRIIVETEYLLTNNALLNDYQNEITLLSRTLTDIYNNLPNQTNYKNLKNLILLITEKIVKNCMTLNNAQNNNNTLISQEIY